MTSINLKHKVESNILELNSISKLQYQTFHYYNQLKKSQFNFAFLRCKSLYKELDRIIMQYPLANFEKTEDRYDKYFYYIKMGLILSTSASVLIYMLCKKGFLSIAVGSGEMLACAMVCENYYYSQKLLPILEKSNSLLKSLIYQAQSGKSYHMDNLYRLVELQNHEKLNENKIEKAQLIDYKQSLESKETMIEFMIENCYAPVELGLENELYFSIVDDQDSEDNNIVLNLINFRLKQNDLKIVSNFKTGVKSVIKII